MSSFRYHYPPAKNTFTLALVTVGVFWFCVACDSAAGPGILPSPIPSSTASPVAERSETPLSSQPSASAPAVTAALQPVDWKTLPVIPVVTRRALEIYQRGLTLGNQPDAFSKVGDCESTTTWFLGEFDNQPPTYNLGSFTNLEPVVRQFHGSYARTSVAVKRGASAAMEVSQLWADPRQCNKQETMLACELRLQKPVIALIMLGSNDSDLTDSFEPYLRQIVEYSSDHGVIPVLSTKADNIEGDGHINATIARLAMEYDVPLWNFYAAVQSLPHHGLQDDHQHLTLGNNQYLFNVPANMQAAWPMRNLTALQTLDSLMRGLQLPASIPATATSAP